MDHISNNIVRQVLLLLLIILLAVLLFWQLQSFLPAMLGAYTLYVLLKKYMFILTGRYKWKKGLTAAVLMFISFLVILLPVALLINMLSSKINYALQHSTQVIHVVKTFIHQYEVRYKVEILSDKNIEQLTSWGTQTLPVVLGATFNTLVTIVFMYFILYFMLINGRKLDAGLVEWVPLKNENVIMLRKETDSLVISNAVGIPLIAIIQGIFAVGAYLVLGVNEPWFWFVVTCIASMMPVVGAALAYVPVSLLFFAEGDTVKGVIMLAYGLGVIGSVDNIFRFWLQKKIGDVHPLITAFGVILGVNLFGFIGLIFGPILISIFILMVRIYINEFSVKKIS